MHPTDKAARRRRSGSEMRGGAAGYLRRWDAAKTALSQRDQQRRVIVVNRRDVHAASPCHA
jgi:hypothetical protein